MMKPRFTPVTKEHPSHEHSLILNENYVARKGDVCCACNEQIVSCKSSVYSCSRNSIITNDNSAELPAYIQNPTNPNESLKLGFEYSRDILELLIIESLPKYRCNVCCTPLPWKVIQFLYYSSDTDIYVCLKCALFHFQRSLEDRKFEHPAHSQHPLALIQRPSSFKCDACKLDDNNKDSSYRCTKCQFWMHKSCADAPTTFQFQFQHQHPLVLSFSLPRVYHKFLQHCRLCKETLNRLDWIYYCCYCRFFAHFQCARSSQMLSILNSGESEKDNSEVVHLPADESSMNLLGEQIVKEMNTLYNNNNNISSSTNSIKHWAQDEHPLQLMTISELNNQKGNDKIICEGCVKPIRTNNDHPFYSCVPCKYFLHTLCGELPTKIEHYPCPGMTMSAFRYKKKYRLLVSCKGCGVPGNGIFLVDSNYQNFHIGCAALLPKMIKHEAHSHKLNQVLKRVYYTCCQACGKTFPNGCNHRCDQCDYYICDGCIVKSRTANHPWDPHPLHLIYDPGMVIGDHVHDFNCEFCSKDINTNLWFYHCSDCDLSFHLDTCFEKSRYQDYSGYQVWGY